jgi:hypothetical protein
MELDGSAASGLGGEAANACRLEYLPYAGAGPCECIMHVRVAHRSRRREAALAFGSFKEEGRLHSPSVVTFTVAEHHLTLPLTSASDTRTLHTPAPNYTHTHTHTQPCHRTTARAKELSQATECITHHPRTFISRLLPSLRNCSHDTPRHPLSPLSTPLRRTSPP